jgi:asparagine synthase (glutamine-hydrolysing)
MCGLAGVYGRAADGAHAAAAAKALAHRGPDGTGMHREPQLLLVHTRLKIIDLSDAARQPMRDPATGVVIAFNGEIYNFQELRAELGAKTFRSQSDTEVILRLYVRDGIACIGRLRGMFGLAIWDPRDRSLHLARDRFGIKPMYWGRVGEDVFFGSEIKGLLSLGFDARPNERAFRSYLEAGRMAHGEQTFFEGIYALPPATVATFRNDTVGTSRYWSPSPVVQPPSGDVEAEIWEIIHEALRLHLIADVPIGISLSSGLDSQFITHALTQVGGVSDRMHTFTYGFDDATYDEIGPVQAIDFGLPVERHFRKIASSDVIPALREAAWYYEMPVGGLGSLSSFLLMKTARQAGLKVLLCGEGSDETFAGYRYYQEAYQRDLARAAGAANSPSEEQGGAVRAPDGSSLGGNAFLGPRLQDAGCAPDGARPRHESYLRDALLADLCVQKLPKLLWIQDRAAMASGIETRVPFLDHVLFERVQRLPSEWLIRDGTSKYLLRRILKRFCGAEPVRLVKHYVATPQREWLKGPLFDEVLSWLSQGYLVREGYIDYPAFKSAYEAYARTPELGNSFFVWKMMDLEALVAAFFADGR